MGKGAEFVVRLPLCEAPGVSTEKAGERTPKSQLRVLVVDDHVDSAESLADLLRIEGNVVEIAFGGASALTKHEATSPTVVFCDIGMPGMTGYEVAKAIRARGRAGVLLIALSGYARADDVKRALEAGFDASVAKPPDPEELRRLLAPGSSDSPQG